MQAAALISSAARAYDEVKLEVKNEIRQCPQVPDTPED
jgi:hypothetical protein